MIITSIIKININNKNNSIFFTIFIIYKDGFIFTFTYQMNNTSTCQMHQSHSNIWVYNTANS
jgi:hypothetical protein